MSSTIDNLLDGVMTASEDGQSTDDRIILSIDEPSRTINYDGELVLGVRGDKFARRIYFKCPQYIYEDNDEVIDLNLSTTKIYVIYKNLYGETYREECAKVGVEDDYYVFSWFISDYVTPKDGVVSFNVCVLDESNTLQDKNGNIIVQEWHTTSAKGTVLPSVEHDNLTPEVITSDTVTSAEIISEYNRLTTELSDVNEYIDNSVKTRMEDRYSENTILISQLQQGTSYTYISEFDFSTFDVDNPSKYVVVVEGTLSRENTDAVLAITECSFTGNTLLIINCSNGELSLQIQCYTPTNSVVIFETDMIVPIAEEVYQTSIETLDSYNSDYPLLCSGDNSTIMEELPVAIDVLRTPNVTVNPVTGVVKASKFVEDGTPISEKYVNKSDAAWGEYSFTEVNIDSVVSIYELPDDVVPNGSYEFKLKSVSSANNNNESAIGIITIPAEGSLLVLVANPNTRKNMFMLSFSINTYGNVHVKAYDVDTGNQIAASSLGPLLYRKVYNEY